MKVVDVKKEKAVVTIILENNKTIIVDFEKKEIINATGRQVKKVMMKLDYTEEISKYRPLFAIIRKGCFEPGIEAKAKALESFWSFIERIDVDDMPNEKPPKGYIKYILENDLLISKTSLIRYKIQQKEKIISEKYSKDWDFFCALLPVKNEKRIQYNNETIIKIVKIFNNSIKNKRRIFNIKDDISSFISYLDSIFLCNSIDITRDAYYNNQMFKTLLAEEKEKIIVSAESKLLPIEQIEHEKFCVIVPKSLADFADEGKQQRNCVGYFYHDSIIMGKNLIYFIRLKDSPNKSLNTCRYNIVLEETAENRIFDNEESSEEVSDFIKKIIDPKIREILNKQKEE